jgi:hypothetical protein
MSYFYTYLGWTRSTRRLKLRVSRKDNFSSQPIAGIWSKLWASQIFKPNALAHQNKIHFTQYVLHAMFIIIYFIINMYSLVYFF